MSQEQEFKLLLKLHRQQMSAKERMRFQYKKSPRPKYPAAIEENYMSTIAAIQKDIVTMVEERMLPLVPVLVARNDGFHTDDIVDQEYERLQKELEEKLVAIYGVTALANKQIKNLLASVAEKTKTFIETGFKQQILAVAGIPFNPLSPNWNRIKATWELTNYTLIKNLSKEYIQKINTIVLSGVQAGWTSAEIAEEIVKLGGKVKGYRAMLIARDQIGKLNNKITKDLHLSLGMKAYLWYTARDERVRGRPGGRYPKAVPSHWEMDSKLCRWDDPSVYSKDAGKTWIKRTGLMPIAEPSQEILCRCMASPVAIDIIAEVDADIERQRSSL